MGPLNGYTVIELAGIGPAPMGGMILADMGAEVIKVERPGAGDGLRAYTALTPDEELQVILTSLSRWLPDQLDEDVDRFADGLRGELPGCLHDLLDLSRQELAAGAHADELLGGQAAPLE